MNKFYLALCLVFLVGCQDKEKAFLIREVERNEDSVQYYVDLRMQTVLRPPIDPVEQTEHRIQLIFLQFKADIFQGRVDSLKYALVKLQ